MDFILDVDGVLTDGSFLYSKEGKYIKNLDHMMLTHLKNYQKL